jgi:hypothetical protein
MGSQDNNEKTLREEDLAQFTGTSQWYKHWSGFLYTEGVRYLAERGCAYWLVDVIAFSQFHPIVRKDPMLQKIQFWKLIVNEDCSARLICERDEGDVVIIEEIPFTDFPLRQVRVYCQQGVLLLPSEY